MSNPELRQQLELDGLTATVKPLDEAQLLPLQRLLLDLTEPYLAPETLKLPINEALKMPFSRPMEREAWIDFMREVNASEELEACVMGSGVRTLFTEVLGGDAEPFPISFFRARIPGKGISVYDWHQDAGTWFVTKQLELAHMCPVTLWTSVNGATVENAVEVIPGSHKNGLGYHSMVKDQGRFRLARTPDSQDRAVKVVCNAGEGVMFDHLTVHRSIPSANTTPRYSLDIRYWSPSRTRRFPVSFRYQCKRWINSWI